MNLQSPKKPTRSAKEKAIDHDLLLLSQAVTSSTSINTLASYQELYDLIINEQLVPGNWYKFPYRSVNFLNGWYDANNNTVGAFPSYDAREVYVGDEEMILVQAISTYEIANDAYSETYQGDVIQFAPYTNKIGVGINIYNSSTLPDSSTVSGFDLQWDGTNAYFNMPTGYPALFGHYFYLYAEFNDGVDSYYQDGIFEPLTPNVSVCQYTSTSNMSRLKVVDGGTKVILLDLTETDVINYVADTLSVDTVYAIDDAYGWITRRTDTLRNISVPFDFRGRKYRRYEVDRFGFIFTISHSTSGSTAIDGIYIIAASNITASGSGATFRVTVYAGGVTDVQIVNKGRSYSDSDTLFIDGILIGGVSGDDDITITVTAITSSVDFWSIGTYYSLGSINVPSDIYEDFKVFSDINTFNINWDGIGGPDVSNYAGYSDNNVFFGECSGVTLKDGCHRNTIGDTFFNSIGNNFIGNTIGDDFSYNTIDDNFIDNTIGNQFIGNTIGDNFNSNTIGDYFRNNTTGNYFNSNTIGNYFRNNTIGNDFLNNTISDYFAYNKIGINFYYNTIGEGFGYGFSTSQGNVIGNYFYQNQIGEYFYNNVIVDGFFGNTVVDYFQLNDIKCSIASVDFSSATYVYGSYNCEIFRRSDNVLRLSYIDGFDSVIYEDIFD